MWNSIKSAAASAVVLAFLAPGLIAQARADSADGVVTVKSAYSVAETVKRIKRDVARKGIMFFAGLDWPVRVLVFQEAGGGVYAAYTDFDWIAKRHGITNRDKEFAMASEVIESVTASVKK
jgi:uncharacterized protein (DUF302 family)